MIKKAKTLTKKMIKHAITSGEVKIIQDLNFTGAQFDLLDPKSIYQLLLDPKSIYQLFLVSDGVRFSLRSSEYNELNT